MKLYNTKFSVKCAAKKMRFGQLINISYATEFQKGSLHWQGV